MHTLINTLTDTQVGILKALLYFNVFRYPLTVDELFEKAQTPLERGMFEADLKILKEAGMLKLVQGYVLLMGEEDAGIAKRQSGNLGVENIMPVAREYSHKIAGFPFVEGVFISGGLSKNYFDENSDIDYFIVTKPGRLWICRTLLIVRYKLLPVNKKKFWCTNYFIASDNLTIPDQNVFTSSELAHLIPMTGHAVYRQLLDTNAWYKHTYPNMLPAGIKPHMHFTLGTLKTLMEWLLKGRLGNALDAWLLNATLKRWRNKYPNLTGEEFDLLFRTRKDVCKRHQHGFQNKVLTRWVDKIKQFEERFNVNLG